jgi:hypothetical protein
LQPRNCFEYRIRRPTVVSKCLQRKDSSTSSSCHRSNMAYWKQEETQGTLMYHGWYILSFTTDVYRPLNTTVPGSCRATSMITAISRVSTSGRLYSNQDRIRAITLARKDIDMNASSVRLCGKIEGHSKKPQSFIRVESMS